MTNIHEIKQMMAILGDNWNVNRKVERKEDKEDKRIKTDNL